VLGSSTPGSWPGLRLFLFADHILRALAGP
jgi:hypothetical protein